MTKGLLETLQSKFCQACHSYSISEDVCVGGTRSFLMVRNTVSLFHVSTLNCTKTCEVVLTLKEYSSLPQPGLDQRNIEP